MPSTMFPSSPTAHLSEAQRQQFEEDGYFIVRAALSPAAVEHFSTLIDELDARVRAERGLSAEEFVEVRNAFAKHPAMVELIDWPSAFPLVAELMGSDIQLCTSHSMLRPPQPKDTPAGYKRIGWHRDGSAFCHPVNGTYPWLYTKIGYFLSDCSAPDCGNLRVMPGSHLRAAKPEIPDGAVDPEGAVTVCVEPGDAVIFQQRLWHSVGPNTSDHSRKNIYVGYCYRWIKALDFLNPPADLLVDADPIRRQLLGAAASEMGYWLPTEEEVPLRTWLAEHSGQRPESGSVY